MTKQTFVTKSSRCLILLMGFHVQLSSSSVPLVDWLLVWTVQFLQKII